MNTKKYHMIIGTLLIMFGFFCTGFSIYIYLKPEVEADMNLLLNNKVNECKTLASNSGFNVEVESTGNVTTLIKLKTKEDSVLDNPMPYIYKASLLISKCNNMKVKKFCVGEGCISEHGSDFVFELERPTIKR